jgi:phosphonate transport system ATP-binding protein
MSQALARQAARLPDPASASPAPLAPMVEIAGIRKAFGDRIVLERIDLSIAPGSAVALIGANGSGKSTLLRIIVRLIEPDSGTVRALGREVTGLDRAGLKAYRARVGVVFQRHNLVGRLSVLTNVVHGVQSRAKGPATWLHSLARAEVRDEAMACLAAVGLADRALQRADSLSGGQSQRVAIARMLMQRPELVLADEPDASLDPRAGEEIMDLLYRLAKERGLGLLVVSHHMEHTIAYSDRIVGLADGRVAFETEAGLADLGALRAFFGRKEGET